VREAGRRGTILRNSALRPAVILLVPVINKRSRHAPAIIGDDCNTAGGTRLLRLSNQYGEGRAGGRWPGAMKLVNAGDPHCWANYLAPTPVMTFHCRWEARP